METANQLESVVPPARHMRTRRFGKGTLGLMTPLSRAHKPLSKPRARRKASQRNKRAVALLIVILVATSLPVLVLALIFTP